MTRNEVIYWPTKGLGEALAGIIFAIFAVAFFVRGQYLLVFLSLCLIFALLRLSDIQEIVFNLKDGLFSARYKTFKEKVEKDIQDNNERPTKENFFRFEKIESMILADLQKKYGGEMKTLIHFMYGQPDKPEFRYTPDGTLQTEDAIYFFEIKYVLKPEFAKSIVGKTVQYLKEVYSKLSPSIGDKKFVIKLILASEYDLSKMYFETSKGIEIEFFKV